MTTIIDKLPGRLMWTAQDAMTAKRLYLADAKQVQAAGCPHPVIVVEQSELSAYITERERKAWEAGADSIDRHGNETDTFQEWKERER